MKKKFDESATSKKKPAAKTAAKKTKPVAKTAAGLKKPKAPAKPKAREITIPAHTIRGFDGLSCYEDGMSGKLRNCSDAYIENQYGYDINVPEQVFAFTSWEEVPSSMDKKTRELLRQAVEREDRIAQAAMTEQQRQAQEAERNAAAAREAYMKDRIVVNHPIVFKRP